MERDVLHEVCPDQIDWLAVQALVDALFTDADTRAFALLNNILDEVKNE